MKEIFNRAIEIESDALTKAFSRISDEVLTDVVKALSTVERIGCSGCGHSGISCQHFAHLMCCIERPARFISPAEAIHGGTGFLQKDDIIVLVSRGGETSELLPIIEICLKKEVKIIAVTENLNSTLAKKAHWTLPIDVSRETDKHNSQGTTSFIVTSALFDALQAAMIEFTDFKNEQFALIHPGGAVGKRLK